LIIKKLIAYPFVHLFYYLGDFVSRFNNFIKWTDLGYKIYGKFMFWSMELNDWAGLNIWKKN
jgi:hypothetical protein